MKERFLPHEKCNGDDGKLWTKRPVNLLAAIFYCYSRRVVLCVMIFESSIIIALLVPRTHLRIVAFEFAYCLLPIVIFGQNKTYICILAFRVRFRRVQHQLSTVHFQWEKLHFAFFVECRFTSICSIRLFLPIVCLMWTLFAETNREWQAASWFHGTTATTIKTCVLKFYAENVYVHCRT